MPRLLNLTNLQQFTAVQLSFDGGDAGGPVIIPSCAQIVINWALEDGKIGHNVLYGRYTGSFAGSVAQANTIMTGLIAGSNWSTLAGFLAASTSITSVTIRNVSVQDQAILQSTSAAGPGTSVSPALPNEVAVCVTLRTALTGRGNRGRMFVPGFATNALGAGNVIAAATVTALLAWPSNITSSFSAAGYTWVLGQKARIAYQGTTGTQHPARPAGSQPIIAAPVRDNHWDSQRRRGLR